VYPVGKVLGLLKTRRAKKYVDQQRSGHPGKAGANVQFPVVQVAFSPGPENAPSLMNAEARPQRQEIVQEIQLAHHLPRGLNGANVQSLVVVALNPEPKNALLKHAKAGNFPRIENVRIPCVALTATGASGRELVANVGQRAPESPIVQPKRAKGLTAWGSLSKILLKMVENELKISSIKTRKAINFILNAREVASTFRRLFTTALAITTEPLGLKS